MHKSQKIIFFVFFISTAICTNLFANEEKNQISTLNNKIISLENAINDGKYAMMRFDNIVEQIESDTPECRFYYDFDTYKLVAVIVDVGHETWSKSFYYFFDKEERIIKYLEFIDRPDNPPRTAIIYDSNGGVLWSNTDKPVVNPDDIKAFYKKSLLYQTEFSKY